MNRLERIKERVGKATPGKWEALEEEGLGISVVSRKDHPDEGGYWYIAGITPNPGDGTVEANSEFIADSKQDVEDLVKVVEAVALLQDWLKRSDNMNWSLWEQVALKLRPLLKEEEE